MTLPYLLFNDIGGSEVVLIFLIVLIFFGPKSIPGIAKTIGRAIYSVRNATDELKEEIKKAGVDVKKDLQIEAILRDEKETVKQPANQTFSGVDHTVHYGGEQLSATVKQRSPKGVPQPDSKESSAGEQTAKNTIEKPTEPQNES